MRASGTALSSARRSEEHTSELQSQSNLVCRLLLEKIQNLDGLLEGGVGQVGHYPLAPSMPFVIPAKISPTFFSANPLRTSEPIPAIKPVISASATQLILVVMPSPSRLKVLIIFSLLPLPDPSARSLALKGGTLSVILSR